MRSSSVKLNIILNRAGLLLISIYINNVRRRMLQQQHHFGEMIAYLGSGRWHSVVGQVVGLAVDWGHDTRT
jgi:hypothetical protein